MQISLFGSDLFLGVGQAADGLNKLIAPLEQFNNLAISGAASTLGRALAGLAVHTAPILALAKAMRDAGAAYKAGLGIGGAIGAAIPGVGRAAGGFLGTAFGALGGAQIGNAITAGVGAGPGGALTAGLAAAPALLDTFTKSLDTMSATLGAGLIPVAAKAIQWIQTFTDWFAANLGPTMEHLGRVLTAVMTAAEPLLWVLGKIVQAIAWVVDRILDLIEIVIKAVTFGFGSGPKRVSMGDMSAGLGLGKGGQMMNSAQLTDKIQGQLLGMTESQLDWLKTIARNNELMLAVLTSMDRKAGRAAVATFGA